MIVLQTTFEVESVSRFARFFGFFDLAKVGD
jgi:hypothetical protein